MKIGVFTDLRFTALSTPTGVTKHIIQMVIGLNNIAGVEVILLGAKDQLTVDGKVPEDNALAHFPARALPHSWHQIYWTSLLFNKPRYNKYTSDLDWVYCPKNDYLPVSNTKLAITIHGAHELDPEYPNAKGLKHFLLKKRSQKHYLRIVKNAHTILTVSDFLKEKTIHWFNANPQTVKIVGNGVEETFYDLSNKTEPHDLKNNLLSVGGLNWLDGGDRIIELARQLESRGISKEIHIAGSQHEAGLLKQAKELKNIKLLGYLNKEQLANTMAKSSALLFLTRYETFGIAAAEAMAVGLPVITLQTTAVPEIVGNGGIYIKEMDEIINLITSNSQLLSDNIPLGKKIAENYHWDKCVLRLAKVLKEC
jgi:glycosyltransferase involved in cell wall biosynthesis